MHRGRQTTTGVPKLAEIDTRLGVTSDATTAHDEMATQLQKVANKRGAVDVFRKMVELDVTNPLPHLRLAEAYCRARSVDNAIESFSTAADMFMKLDRPRDALKAIERILCFRRDPDLARLAAELYLRQGDRKSGRRALAKLQIAFEANPKDLDTLGLLARAFACIGEKRNAREVCKEMARQARDQGRTDLYVEILRRLKTGVSNSDWVQVRTASSPPASTRAEGATLDDDDLEVIEEHVELLDDDLEVIEEHVELLDDDLEVIEEDVDVLDDVEVIPDRASSTAERIFALPDHRSSLPAPRPPVGSTPEILMLDDDVEVIEEVVAGDSFEASAHSRQAIKDAESFRKLRLFSKAISTLRTALELEPQSLALRHKLRDLLIEAG